MLEPVPAAGAQVGLVRLVDGDLVVVELDRGDGRVAPVPGEVRVVVDDLILVVVVLVVLVVRVVLIVLVHVLDLVVVLIRVVVAGLVLVVLDVVDLAVPVAVLVVVLPERPALEVADQGSELARQGVDLVAAQSGPRGQLRLGVVEDAVEPHHERVVALPLVARLGQAPVHLGEGGVERGAPDRALGKRDHRVLAFMQ